MGRIEKAIVLSVLLGVILILAVSMDRSGGAAGVPDVPPASAELTARGLDHKDLEGVGPRKPDINDLRKQGDDPALASKGPSAKPVVLEPEAAPKLDAPQPEVGSKPTALLSAGIEAQPERAPESLLPADSALITLEGLERTSDETLMSYRWTIGDSFAELAERFYGHVDYVTLLQRVNEGNMYRAEGDEILIPVYDLVVLNDDVAKGGADPLPVAGAGQYVVREGDSLWTISKKTLGKGSRWKEIHALNVDKLPRADAVRVGMVLRIPE
jgi:nucleoid-associated protein YgaU